MPEEKILTLHPAGKSGRNIDMAKYEMLKAAILDALDGCSLTHTELMAAIRDRLPSSFQGSVGWYAETVKLDLEARKLIERTADKPQKYKLTV